MVNGEWVFITAGGQRWHTRADCEALIAGWEEAKAKGASTHPARQVPMAEAEARLPCGWCAVGRPSSSRVEHVTALAGMRVDTDYEAKFRDHVLGELPELTGWTMKSQRDITVNAVTYRADFTLEEGSDRIAIEIDGANKGPGGLTHDDWTRRQTALTSEGWVVLRFTNRQVRDEQEYCRRQVAVTVARLRERRLQAAAATAPAPVATLAPRTRTVREPVKETRGVSTGARVLIGAAALGLAGLGIQYATSHSGGSGTGTSTLPTISAEVPARSTPEPVTPPTASEAASEVAASAAPISKNECPSEQSIKGNIREDGTRYYHLPEWEFYKRTNPEVCFRDVASAVKAGFSKPPQAP